MKLTVKLAFFKDKTGNKLNQFVRNTIQWWTRSKYYHVEIIIGDVWIGAKATGIHVDKLRPLKSVYDYVDVPVDITEAQKDTLIKWIASKRNAKYDFLGIFLSMVLPARIDNPNKWFCSELVTKILQLMLNEKTYDLIPNMVSPEDLAKIYGVSDE